MVQHPSLTGGIMAQHPSLTGGITASALRVDCHRSVVQPGLAEQAFEPRCTVSGPLRATSWFSVFSVVKLVADPHALPPEFGP
jgi:hypothetical protein